jgi:hypothetical protein
MATLLGDGATQGAAVGAHVLVVSTHEPVTL